jgi:GT2 family glycosyltransferase
LNGGGHAVRVSVVVPTHAATPALAACLRSLAASRPRPHEVLLVRDGDVPGVDALAAEAGAILLHTETRRGAASARNAGARAASGDVVLFLDSDVAAPPDLVGRVAEAFDAQPGLTAAIGSYDAEPSAPAFVSQYRNLLHHYVHQTSASDASTFWGACGAIRRRALLDAGGFDESYGAASIEDIELGVRLRRAGATLRLDPTLQVKHLKRWTFASFLWTDVFRRALPWTRLMLREGHMPNDLNLRVRHRLALVTSLALVASLPALALGGFAIAVPPGLLAVFVALNAGFFAFLWRTRPLLAVAAVPLHVLHNLAGGAGFALGLVAHVLGPRPGSRRVDLLPAQDAPERGQLPGRHQAG